MSELKYGPHSIKINHIQMLFLSNNLEFSSAPEHPLDKIILKSLDVLFITCFNYLSIHFYTIFFSISEVTVMLHVMPFNIEISNLDDIHNI